MKAEINRKILEGWRQFGKLNRIFKADISLILQNEIVRSMYTFRNDLWVRNVKDNKKTRKKLSVTQRAMERSMIEIKRIDKIKNEHIRKQTTLVDIKRTIKSNKRR